MSKLSIKPVWIGALALLVAVAMAVRLGFAITAFVPGDAPIGYVAQDRVTSFNLKTGTEALFRPEYQREFWSGDLVAYSIDATGNLKNFSTPTNPTPWGEGAADKLDKQTSRYIATMMDDGTPVPFRLDSLSPAQQTWFGSSTALGNSMVNFLRGDRVNEGTTYRIRKHRLGDIVHSRPYYVADATNPTVFVGANDGMVHAVNKDDGTERWAYVPSMLLPKMAKLSVNPYVHDYYVDGQINVAKISSGTKRILVGGLGGGGKGLYALDITGLAAGADSDVAAKVMWEITPTTRKFANSAIASNDFVNLGYTYGTVTLAKVGGVDAVIVGNGYNDGGDYHAYLYVIDAATGQLLQAIKAGTDGTAASPNGLSTAVAVDSNGNGSVDLAYAGDLNGKMWRFDLVKGTASVLLDTLTASTPAQPITSTPGVAIHPNGGYMVTFGTGRMLTSADSTDNKTAYYAYGVWDGAPAANKTLLTQTLTERSYTANAVTTRVRRVTSNKPDWTSGNNNGWRVALPAGERVVGEGSFIENGRFYFTSYNPTIGNVVKTSGLTGTASTTVEGENWLMELDYLSGGSQNQPFLDLNGDVKLNNDDRITCASDDVTLGMCKAAELNKPIMTTDGISVGKFISIGVLSQPILVQLTTLNDTLFNQNPDITVTKPLLQDGVIGGHFDQDIYYGRGTPGARASATITVNTTGQTSPFPATLGSIQVVGVEMVPALSVADLPDGGNSDANAETIRSKVGAGFSATRSGNTITITAPVGASYNGKVFTINDGTSQALVPGVTGVTAVAPAAAVAAVRPTGFITFSGTTSGTNDLKINNRVNNDDKSLTVGGNDAYDKKIDIGSGKTPVQAAAAVVAAVGSGGTYQAYVGGNTITPLCAAKPLNVVCIVDTSTDNNGSNNNQVIAVGALINGTASTDLTYSTTNTAGGVTAAAAVAAVTGVAAVPQSGWTNFKPALASTPFIGGIDATMSGDTCTGRCNAKNHVHQYDKQYNVTGVNFLNPSLAAQALEMALPRGSPTEFKVLVQNQYLSPAVKMHIGHNPLPVPPDPLPDPLYYRYNVDVGYIKLKDYQTTATLDLAKVQTYVNADKATASALPIGSFAINMPVDALTPRDWWGNGDKRAGLHPSVYSCVIGGAGSSDGNMYQPVIPPDNGVDGPGVNGWNSSSTPDTATGVRHNGALTIQVIAANTPQDAIEQSVPGRPEYGWRVKSKQFANYVLVEFSTHWHHPNELCYGTKDWTKAPYADTGGVTKLTPPDNPNHADPLVGNLGGGDSVVKSIITTVNGNLSTTVISYVNASFTATIYRTTNPDGSVTIVTRSTSGDLSAPQTFANAAGAVRAGGNESGLTARTGRISWRELVAP